jgi:hypothetical protein
VRSGAEGTERVSGGEHAGGAGLGGRGSCRGERGAREEDAQKERGDREVGDRGQGVPRACVSGGPGRGVCACVSCREGAGWDPAVRERGLRGEVAVERERGREDVDQGVGSACR